MDLGDAGPLEGFGGGGKKTASFLDRFRTDVNPSSSMTGDAIA